MSHPYKSQPSKAFWKSAVADRSPFDLADLYEKKFDILPEDRIATGGSCFAQHIGKRMQRSGFTYMDAEPAPRLLPRAMHADFGYGVYSARYGNLYTAAQLNQLYDRAFGTFSPADDIWETRGRWYDAFRPNIEKNGFESRDEVVAARDTHYAAVRRLFTEANIYVFTLGLTEAWVSKRDGAVYPTCPGTIAGTFDEARYAFRNFTAAEVIADLRAFIGKVRAINPTIRILLTVSPVALAATATRRHVLPATIYSKSVLRAAAGELSETHDFIDYFPSFEIISSHPMRGMFFEPGMREVNPAGVDFVMSHFFKVHSPPPRVKGEGRPARVRKAHRDEIVCEEAVLEAWAS